jgi:broad specificity phosphatase PhoE
MVVCHGNIMRCLLSHLGFAKFDELTRKSVENTAYFVLESDGIDFFIKETSGIKKMQGEIRPF